MSESASAADASVVSPGNHFNRLVEIMARLRAPDGCPWDREQSLATLRKYLLEETYEVLDAIDAGDHAALCDELGDLMLQLVFQAQIAAEAGHFTIGDSIEAIVNKLIRRHPHVFGNAEARTAGDVTRRWDQIKAQEKQAKGEAPRALLDGVPRSQPALSESQEITAKVAKVGFDWPSKREVFAKLHEEIAELEEAIESGDRKAMDDELGDLLFVAVNLARKLSLDAEMSLRGANRKFRARFGYAESAVAAQGRPLGTATLDEMEEQWQQAKIALRTSPSAP
ncbi:MAG: nucleoside triphosphate pyrophosphohydrolase [Acidobacteria bacterium]|nr:nucleoside triphosphate pyrophosphohydrolase [Acidobacteriota bacterium]